MFFRHSPAGSTKQLLQASEEEGNTMAQRKITGPASSMGQCTEF